jgi:seryl-tRNA(Sec) selenium transferase
MGQLFLASSVPPDTQRLLSMATSSVFAGCKFALVGDFGSAETKVLKHAITSSGGALAYVIGKDVRFSLSFYFLCVRYVLY